MDLCEVCRHDHSSHPRIGSLQVHVSQLPLGGEAGATRQQQCGGWPQRTRLATDYSRERQVRPRRSPHRQARARRSRGCRIPTGARPARPSARGPCRSGIGSQSVPVQDAHRRRDRGLGHLDQLCTSQSACGAFSEGGRASEPANIARARPARATTRVIASRAGVSQATIYRHFQTSALLLADAGPPQATDEPDERAPYGGRNLDPRPTIWSHTWTRCHH